jgi:hypothetical protein
MANAFMHVQLYTDAVPAARQFYGDLFAWEIRDLDGGDASIDPGVGVGGGMTHQLGPHFASFWLPFVEVADAGAVLDAARARGARVVVALTDLGAAGHYGIFVDPWGARVGVWQPPAVVAPTPPAPPAPAVASGRSRKPARAAMPVRGTKRR